MLKANDQDQQTDIIILDFSKAFDTVSLKQFHMTVPHEELL